MWCGRLKRETLKQNKMQLNTQLGWAGSSVNYADHSHSIKNLNHKHLLAIFAILAGALFAGTGAVINVLASRQLSYQPATNFVSTETTEQLPAATPPPQTPPVQQPAVVAENPAPPDASAKVQAVLDSWATSHGSQQWSVVVQGLGTSQTKASLNPTIEYDPASVFKLYFTYTLFQNYTLDSLSKNFLTIEGRGSVSMKDCLDQMIKSSDNPCGAAMGNRLGWGKTNTALKKLGFSGTDLNNPNGLTTTAADANLFLQKLNGGEVMSPENQQYVISLMQQQKYRGGIPAGCAGCTVADKTGDLGSVRHDVGIVQYPSGSYTIAIMTNGATYSQIAQLTAQIQSVL